MQNSFNISISNQEEVEKKDKRRSFFLSFCAHLILLLLLLLPFARYSEPNEQFSGILVNFGDPDGGLQEQVTQKNVSTPPAITKPSEPTPPKPTPDKKTAASAISAKITEEKETKIIATEKKVEKIENTKTEKAQTVETPAVPTKSAEEIQKEKEAERLAVEHQKQEQERKRQEQEYQEAKSDFDNVFSSSKGTGENNNPAGSPDGAFDQENLATQSYGTGDVGQELGDRKVLYSPKIVDRSQKTGIVVVKICVDKSGKVTTASFTQKGSTTHDNQLVDLAIKNAKKYKFSTSELAMQCGKISIHFKLK